MNTTQKQAIKLAIQYNESITASTKLAIKFGAALIAVRNNMPRGTFQPWVAKHIPFSYSHCEKCIAIAKIPGLSKLSILLSLKSELRLRKEDKQTINIIRKLNAKHRITEAELLRILKDPYNILTEIKYIKTLVSTLNNKINIAINHNMLSKQEKLEIASSLRKIIKATK